MAIEYIIETILIMGFMLSVLVVCKWVEDIKAALEEAKASGKTLWQILGRKGDEVPELVDQDSTDGPVVYLKVSNPQVPVKTSVRLQAHELAMKKAANSE